MVVFNTRTTTRKHNLTSRKAKKAAFVGEPTLQRHWVTQANSNSTCGKLASEVWTSVEIR